MDLVGGPVTPGELDTVVRAQSIVDFCHKGKLTSAQGVVKEGLRQALRRAPSGEADIHGTAEMACYVARLIQDIVDTGAANCASAEKNGEACTGHLARWICCDEDGEVLPADVLPVAMVVLAMMAALADRDDALFLSLFNDERLDELRNADLLFNILFFACHREYTIEGMRDSFDNYTADVDPLY